ncbi:uncharacterized protein LOC114874399 [Osmia bicornis bicornis]|uniref:uncharacterized protein LOC114874399 n=1 Tax=Osmia bicornis bicornis TaxID=1437191 RepID=UPI0010F63F0E|nr:uncharacterized protein LOC114874399 [Osmia bicornis bicornis]XP_029039465.1 uncharacterized protein LOC114874399 [Osmia bicornis bicornis]XP_029039466.1 uncharacterized protein LOC114874399 [Osmia bicornis bicornis]
MGSTRQQDRLLSGGISLPQWMKGRADNRFDFDESTFSPPSHDDSFFYIRYPKTQNRLGGSEESRSIDEVLAGQAVASSTAPVTAEKDTLVAEPKKSQEIDFSKHPIACQPFVPSSTTNKDSEIRYAKSLLTENVKAKSQGIDDGFHGEPALCGKSIVLVASQMMSNKFHETFTAEPAGSELKRVSKSLPVTPIASPAQSPNSSPKARRRISSNRYFTASFLLDREKYQGGSILASILGQSREIVTAKIEEEDETNMEIPMPSSRALSRKRSISSQNLTYVGTDEKSADKATISTNAMRAKPSELREMNFWSPTSM